MLGFFAFQREATLHGMQGPSQKLLHVTHVKQRSCRSVRKEYRDLQVHFPVCILSVQKEKDHSFPAVNANDFTATYLKDSGVLSSIELDQHMATSVDCGRSHPLAIKAVTSTKKKNHHNGVSHIQLVPIGWNGGFHQLIKPRQPVG